MHPRNRSGRCVFWKRCRCRTRHLGVECLQQCGWKETARPPKRSVACRSPPAHAPTTQRQHTTHSPPAGRSRSEEHTSELQSLMRISYAVFCLNKNTHTTQFDITNTLLLASTIHKH